VSEYDPLRLCMQSITGAVLKTAMRILAVLVLLALSPSAVAAQEDLCVNRPGLDTPPCTLAAGRAIAEVGALGWDHTGQNGGIADDLTLADTLLRIGLGSSTELQIGLGGWNHQRMRGANGMIAAARGLGDTSIGVRHGFGSEADARLAVQVTVTLPTGGRSISAGDWGAGLVVPMAFPLPSGFTLSFSPEVNAAVNGAGHGRHLAWGAAAGIGHALGPALSFTGEIAAYRDEDPAGASTDARFAASLAWRVGPQWQIDLELDKGLTAGAPTHALKLGFARAF
jgi:hypothetical protein